MTGTALVAAWCALAQAQMPARDTRPAVTGATAIVSGVILSDEARPRPLRRARVTINGSALTMGRTAITGDDGTFAFEELPAGRYSLAAAKDAYVTMNYGALRSSRPGTSVMLRAGEHRQIELRLPPGAVITGVVTDADGLPAQGIAVNALAYRYVGSQGERRFIPATIVTGGVSTSDDRGVYRIFGLPAGEYVVAAQPQQARQPTLEIRQMSQGSVNSRPVMPTQVFHQGAIDVGRAFRVTVGPAEERSGIDIQLQYVPLATISGTVTVPTGWNAATVMMVRADEVPGFAPSRNISADANGRFTFSSIPPGQYRIVARSTEVSRTTNILSASAEIGVDGEDVTNVSLSLQPGLAISGRVAFEGERPAPELPVRVPIQAFSRIANLGYPVPPAQVEKDGRFSVTGILPSAYRLFGSMQGIRTPIGPWWLKSIVVNGQDLLDSALELRQSAEDAVVTFTDRASEVEGTVRDAQGNALSEAFVVIFSADRSAWFFNSRRVAGVRPDAQGHYSVRNLPPGEYRIASTTDLEQGEWFDPAVLERVMGSAGRLTLTGVERKTQDLTIR